MTLNCIFVIRKVIIYSEEHYLEIESRYFKNRLNIKQVSPDLDNKDFIMIRGGYSS